MKTRIIIWLVMLLLVLGSVTMCSHMQSELSRTTSNYAALQEEYHQATTDAMAFKHDLVTLRQSNDSTIKELLKVRDEVKVKDKRIQSLLGHKDYIYVTDTLVLPVVEMLKEEVMIDTTVGDQWYTTHLALDSSSIQLSTKMKSQLEVVTYQTREYINPSPCWLKRLFQRKHTITRVHVKQLNPYIIQDSSQTMFIQID